MKTATASALRSRLGEFLNQTEPVVVTQQGRPKAVLLHVKSQEDVERLLLANNRELMKLLDQADRRITETGGVTHDDFWAQATPKPAGASHRPPKRKPTDGRGSSS